MRYDFGTKQHYPKYKTLLMYWFYNISKCGTVWLTKLKEVHIANVPAR